MSSLPRRRFLASLGAGAGAVGLAGCVGRGLPGSAPRPDLTVYVGAYHWGFVLLDEAGTERERIVLDPGTAVEVVAFNVGAEEAIAALPSSVGSAVPDHEALEERNEERVPEPVSGDLHDALEEANERYPDHSLAVMPSGYNEMPMDGMGGGMDGPMGGGSMGGGMVLRPIPLPHDAPRPTMAGLVATERGNFTLSCLTYCGYGHAFMELPGALVVR